MKKVLFNRSKNYLHYNTEQIGLHNEDTRASILNVLVVFKEGSSEGINYLTGEPERNLDSYTDQEKEAVCNNFDTVWCDKDHLSVLAHTADCHMTISNEIAKQTTLVNRTIKLDCANENLTGEFISKLNHLRETGSSIEFTKDDLRKPIGYTYTCECGHAMTGIEIDDMGQKRFLKSISENERNWLCKVCGRVEEDTEITKPIYLSGTFKSASKITILNISEHLEDDATALQCQIEVPINVARVTCYEGTKAICRETSNKYLGQLSGQIWNPSTKQLEDLSEMQIDAVIPYGAFKSKENGMTLAWNRFLNAYFNMQINPEDYEQAGILGNYEEYLTDIWQNSDITWSRTELVEKDIAPVTTKSPTHKWRVSPQIVKTSTKDGLRFGIVELRVTEFNEEFAKMDTEIHPMKFSPTNDVFYRTFGLHKLADLLRENSLEGIHDVKTKDGFVHLMRAANFNPDSTYSTIEIADLPKAFPLPFVNIIPASTWQEVRTNHPFFNDKRFENGVSIPLNVKGMQMKFTIPPKRILLSLVSITQFGNRTRLRSSLKKMFELYSTLTNNPQNVSIRHLKGYIESINQEFDGKRGLLTKASTYLYKGIKAKKTSDGFIPQGVVVADVPGMWKAIWRDSEYKDLEYSEFIRRVSLPIANKESIQIFGINERSPLIWYTQCLNAVEIWHPDKANRYFLYKYEDSFYDHYPQFKQRRTDNGPRLSGSGGIVNNVLDALYIYQEDSDGDLTRVLTPMNPQIQLALRQFNTKIRGYRILTDTDYPAINTIHKQNRWWHLSYVLKELQGNTSLEFTNKYRYTLRLHKISTQDRNAGIIAAAASKAAIGYITKSSETILEIAGYMYKSQQSPHKDSPAPITFEEMTDVCGLYQKALLQDGTIRSVKHVSGELNSLTLDALSVNQRGVKSSIPGEENTSISPRNKIMELSTMYNSQFEAGKILCNIAEFWKKHGAVHNGSMSIKKSSKIARIIRAFLKLRYSNKGGFEDNENYLKYLTLPEAQYMFSYEANKDLIKVIKELYNPQVEKLFK